MKEHAEMLRLAKPDVLYEKSFKTAFNDLKNDTERMAWVYLGEAGF
jgi:hypothetical protein